MLKTTIVNPENGRRTFIDDAEALRVSQRANPPFGEPLDSIIFNSFLTDAAGSKDMRVVATPAAPEVFSVRSVQGSDLYITGFQFLISGSGLAPNFFGGTPGTSPLIDPCILTYETETLRVVLDDTLFSNFDFIRLGGELLPAVGSRADSLLVDNATGGGNNSAYVPYIDFRRVYGFQWGIRLAANSEQRFDLVIQDDTSANTDFFECKVFGFLRGPNSFMPGAP